MFEVKEVNVVAVNRRFLFSVVVQLILILKPRDYQKFLRSPFLIPLQNSTLFMLKIHGMQYHLLLLGEMIESWVMY